VIEPLVHRLGSVRLRDQGAERLDGQAAVGDRRNDATDHAAAPSEDEHAAVGFDGYRRKRLR
jgi:hypothetical protein